MVTKKGLKKQSTGPVTALGKSRSALNALKHGGLSSKLLLPSESSEELDQLMRDMALDLRPAGVMENILVEKIVGVLWRKRRLEGAEQDALSSIQMQAITDTELKDALGLHRGTVPDWMAQKDIFGTASKIDIKELPKWMLDENNAPSDVDGLKAVQICNEWKKFKDERIEAENEQQARDDFPLHWSLLDMEMEEVCFGGVLDYLQDFYEAENFYQGFHRFMFQQQANYYWIAYWHCNREKVSAAFRAIRVKRMLGQWDLDRAHRYHTMLDNQLFKMLREFREIRSWRISNLDMVNEAGTGTTKSK